MLFDQYIKKLLPIARKELKGYYSLSPSATCTSSWVSSVSLSQQRAGAFLLLNQVYHSVRIRQLYSLLMIACISAFSTTSSPAILFSFSALSSTSARLPLFSITRMPVLKSKRVQLFPHSRIARNLGLSLWIAPYLSFIYCSTSFSTKITLNVALLLTLCFSLVSIVTLTSSFNICLFNQYSIACAISYWLNSIFMAPLANLLLSLIVFPLYAWPL